MCVANNTAKKFFVIANLVRQHPVDELVAQLKSRKIISKEQVIRESKNNSFLFIRDWTF
jgi:E3 SUMO-protein ligase PIAS1